MALPLGLILMFAGFGALGVMAASKSEAKAPLPSPTPPGGTPPKPPVVPVSTTPPAVVPATPADSGSFYAPAPNLTTEGKVFDLLGQQMTAAFKALGVKSDGTITPGVATAEAVQAATALAALLEANGLTTQAAQLREYAKKAAAGLTVPPCKDVPASLPTAVATAVCRALYLERDPAVLRQLVTAIRGLPQSSDPQVMALIKLLEATIVQLEAAKSEAIAKTDIDAVLTSKTPAEFPMPKASPPTTLPAELQAMLDAAWKALGVDAAGVVRGPYSSEATRIATDAATALEGYGYTDYANQLRNYIKILEGMRGATPATSTTTPAPASSGRVHIVKSGDTGQSIAKLYTGDVNRWRELIALNPQMGPNGGRPHAKEWGFVARPGESVKLPSSWSSAAPSATPAAAPPAVLVTSTPAAVPAPAGPKVHIVKSGDTGQSIAKLYTGDVNRWRELIALNPQMGPNGGRAHAKEWGFVARPGESVILPAGW